MNQQLTLVSAKQLYNSVILGAKITSCIRETRFDNIGMSSILLNIVSQLMIGHGESVLEVNPFGFLSMISTVLSSSSLSLQSLGRQRVGVTIVEAEEGAPPLPPKATVLAFGSLSLYFSMMISIARGDDVDSETRYTGSFLFVLSLRTSRDHQNHNHHKSIYLISYSSYFKAPHACRLTFAASVICAT